MSDAKKERFRSGPENETFNLMKGYEVQVFTLDHPESFIEGVLVWVDVYTLGIRESKNQSVPIIVYKGPGVVVRAMG